MIHTKEDVNFDDLKYVKGNLFIVIGHLLNFAESRSLPVTVTNILENVGVSQTHSNGRSVDIRTRDWSMNDIAECMCYLRQHVGHLGAISSRNNQPNVVIYHDSGLGPHLHLQVAS